MLSFLIRTDLDPMYKLPYVTVFNIGSSVGLRIEPKINIVIRKPRFIIDYTIGFTLKRSYKWPPTHIY